MAEQPPKGRKSLLSQQAVKEGLSFNSSNVDGLLQDLPKTLKLTTAVTRVRNVSSRRHGSVKSSSSLVTPVSRTLAPRSGTTSSRSQIPRPPARRLNAPESSTRGNPAGTGAASSANRAPSTAFGRSTSRSTMKPTLSRSVSVESFADSTMSMFRTPASRNRSRSPGSASRDKPTVSKLGNMPTFKDKEALNGMIEKIIGVLRALNYSQEPSLASFRSLGGTELQKMLSFLLQLMVGPNNGKDEITFIQEGLCTLGCPAPLSKSQLKTLSVPHVMATAITSLAWLSCLIEEFMGLGLEQPNICDDAQYIENDTWDCYKRLFFCELYGEDVNVNEEIDAYRKRLTAVYDGSADVSLVDLQTELEEKLQLKENVFSQEDARSAVLATLRGQDEILDHEAKRVEELQKKLCKYTNLTALQSEQTHLESTLARLQRELKSLHDLLQGQTISKVEAERKMNEIASMKKQQDSIMVVLENLEKKLRNQEQFLRNDKNRFYEVCCGFSILERFNESARKWSDIVPQLEKNTFEVHSMGIWLKTVKQKIAAAKRILEKRRENYSEEERLCQHLSETLDEKLSTLEEECNRLESELSFQGHEQQKTMEQILNDLEKAEKELKESMRVVNHLQSEIEVKRNNLAEVEKLNEDNDKKIEDLSAQLVELNARVERLHAQHRYAEVELQTTLLAYITDARSKVFAPLTELDDPEFRRIAVAKYEASEQKGKSSGSKEGGNNSKDPPQPPYPGSGSSAAA